LLASVETSDEDLYELLDRYSLLDDDGIPQNREIISTLCSTFEFEFFNDVRNMWEAIWIVILVDTSNESLVHNNTAPPPTAAISKPTSYYVQYIQPEDQGFNNLVSFSDELLVRVKRLTTALLRLYNLLSVVQQPMSNNTNNTVLNDNIINNNPAVVCFKDPIVYPYIFFDPVQNINDTSIAAMITLYLLSANVKPLFVTNELLAETRINFAYWLCTNGNLPI
jgi:hypothetical protein